MIFRTLFQFYVFLDFRFYPRDDFFMPIKRDAGIKDPHFSLKL